jgi:hypothetical protein
VALLVARNAKRGCGGTRGEVWLSLLRDAKKIQPDYSKILSQKIVLPFNTKSLIPVNFDGSYAMLFLS